MTELATGAEHLDRALIRRDCAEAYDLAMNSLVEGSEPPTEQVKRLREALSGHLRALVDAVGEDFAGAAPGPLHDVVVRTLSLAEKVLAQPVRGSVLDLLASPQVARLLTLMYEDPVMFGADPELFDLHVDAWGSTDAG